MKHVNIIKKCYYDFYVNHNLKIINKFFNIKWLCIEEIIEKENPVSGFSNSYLQNEDNCNLALDILNNGMYWIYIIDEKYRVAEGCHRIKSIKNAFKKGLWPADKKLCCLIQNKDVELSRKISNEEHNTFENFKQLEDQYNISLNTNEEIYMWCTNKKNYWKHLKNKQKYEAKEIKHTLIGDFYLIKINNLAEMIDCLINLHIALREDLFIYHGTNLMIPTPKIINDEYEFNKWKNNMIDDESYKKKFLVKNNIDFNFLIDNNENIAKIYLNNIKISNLIDICIISNTLIIRTHLNSNLLFILNTDLKNIIKINEKEFNIKEVTEIEHCHSNIGSIRFFQKTIFKIEQ